MDSDRFEEVELEYGWSPTRLGVIQQCGKKYEWRYIKRLKPAKSVHLAFGSAIHEVLYEMWQGLPWDDGVLMKAWDDVWYKHAKDVDWTDVAPRQSSWDKKGAKLIRNYKGFSISASEQPFLFEKQFKTQATDTLPPMHGIIDKVIRDNQGLAVIDYKSGKNPPNQLILDRDPQFTMYYAGARDIIGEEVNRFAIHHLQSSKLYWTTRTQADLEDLAETFRDAQAKVDQKMFSRNVTFTCQWCDYKVPCLGK